METRLFPHCAGVSVEAVDLANEALAEVYAPYVHRRFEAGDPEWADRVAQARREWRRRRLTAGLKRLWRGPPRRPDRVKASYEQIWGRFTFRELLPDPGRKLYAVQWGGQGMLANAWGVPRVHLFCLMRLIETLRPASVLEVGSGRGLNLLALAARFPDVRFAGIELSERGCEAARAVAAQAALPEELAQFIPFEPRDVNAIRRIAFHGGSAAKLPFGPNAFDLVFTRQALEQMEAIRGAALSEIARVAARYTVMFEAFRDWNDTGMKRDRAAVTGYFRARIADLRAYGLEPVLVKADLPHKIYMQVGLVVSQAAGGCAPGEGTCDAA
ncbi:MAG: class I SAM-dependent methyltransferase [Lentisphaerae bacterium]|nr:class I SAM-dependent methyltransferase [Lentisphaerota bacterium]